MFDSFDNSFTTKPMSRSALMARVCSSIPSRELTILSNRSGWSASRTLPVNASRCLDAARANVHVSCTRCAAAAAVSWAVFSANCSSDRVARHLRVASWHCFTRSRRLLVLLLESALRASLRCRAASTASLSPDAAAASIPSSAASNAVSARCRCSSNSICAAASCSSCASSDLWAAATLAAVCSSSSWAQARSLRACNAARTLSPRSPEASDLGRKSSNKNPRLSPSSLSRSWQALTSFAACAASISLSRAARDSMGIVCSRAAAVATGRRPNSSARARVASIVPNTIPRSSSGSASRYSASLASLRTSGTCWWRRARWSGGSSARVRQRCDWSGKLTTRPRDVGGSRAPNIAVRSATLKCEKTWAWEAMHCSA
mmetsp:Transcript_13331/g.25465  ORF Transcript_13331/g.25465 Transcript_13331/m.25465 type:complete len:375 (-) Transcript_13331:330-1454(-)